MQAQQRLTAQDFDPELLELYDYYAHGMMSKREFLDRAGKFAVGGVTAVALLNMLSPTYAFAEQVSFNDPDIKAEYVEYESPEGNGTVRFHKDGYTDIRGRFDYASLSGPKGSSAKRYSILLMSEKDGAMVREAASPTQ